MEQLNSSLGNGDKVLSDYQNLPNRLQTPNSILNASSMFNRNPVGDSLVRNVQSQGRSRLDDSKMRPQDIFNQTFQDAKHPPFNVRTSRPQPAANSNGFVKFNPGPGSYSTRVSSIKKTFIGRESGYSGLVSTHGKPEEFVYYTKENGGLIKHVQTMKLDKTVKDGVGMAKDKKRQVGPGFYNVEEHIMSSVGGNINPIPPKEEQIHGVDMKRPAKSQQQNKRRWAWDEKQNKLVVRNDEERQNALDRAKMTMQQRIRKQKKWHELLEKPTVPSIPPKDKQVPQGEDDDDNGPLSSDEEKQILKREQVIQMIQATPPASQNDQANSGFYSHKMQYQTTEQRTALDSSGGHNINNDLVNANVVSMKNKAQKKMTMTTLNEYQSQDGGMSHGTIRDPSKSRMHARANMQPNRQQTEESKGPKTKNGSLKLDVADSKLGMHQREERNRLISESVSDHNEDDVDQIGTQRKSVGSQQDLITRNQYSGLDNRNEVTLSQEQLAYKHASPVGTRQSINNLGDKRSKILREHPQAHPTQSGFSNTSLNQKIRTYPHTNELTNQNQSKTSQYQDLEVRPDQRMAGMATGLTVEMKVNQKSRTKSKKHKQQYKEIDPITPDKLLSSGKKTEVQDITDLPNRNQQKSYNKKFEFFTKPLGPGHYNPNQVQTRPSTQGIGFGALKEKRSQTVDKKLPGPGEYKLDQEDIQNKQIKNLKKQEDQYEKDRGRGNFSILSGKVQHGRPGANYSGNKERHLIQKHDTMSRRGPGQYPVQEKATSFKPLSRREQIQFFNSTENRFGKESRNNALVGPGAYETVGNMNLPAKRLNTAAFLGKRPDDLFGANGKPGPGDYAPESSTMNTSFNAKVWGSTVQAFGSTERRMPTQSHSVSQSLPGPGTYASERHKKLVKNCVIQRVRGQFIRMKSQDQKASASFASKTTRQIQKELNHAQKLNYPAANHYSDQHLRIGNFSIEGGAPNNFLLMKNDRQRAPFNSTVAQLSINKHQSNNQSDPGHYNFEKSMVQVQRENDAKRNRSSNFAKCDRFEPVKKDCNFRIAPKVYR